MNRDLAIILTVIILALAVVIAYQSEHSSDSVEVNLSTDGAVSLGKFIQNVEKYEFYEGYDNETLNYLKTCDSNSMVFSSDNDYYIVSKGESHKIPLEFATDVSIYAIVNCHIDKKMPLGGNLGDIVFISDVEYLRQDIVSYEV